jgi:hypothetical protein
MSSGHVLPFFGGFTSDEPRNPIQSSKSTCIEEILVNDGVRPKSSIRAADATAPTILAPRDSAEIADGLSRGSKRRRDRRGQLGFF